jgi:serine/threonine protein kinase
VDWDWNVTVGGLAHSLVSGADPPTADAFLSIGSCYLAPECYENHFTMASDIFSFGLVLYRLIVGRAPYPSKLTAYGLAKRIAIAGVRPEIPDSVPPLVKELISDCCASDPDDRPRFREIVRRLEAVNFRLTEGVRGSKVASFVQKITDWEADHGLADIAE